MAKIAFIDLETTGVNPDENGVVQIGVIVEIDGRVEEKLNLSCRPFDWKKVDKEALEVIGHTMDSLKKLPKPKTAFHSLRSTLEKYVDKYDSNDKFHFVGYNADFDDSFLRQFFEDNNEKYYGSYFWFPALDLAKLVGIRYMRHRHTFKNFKLMTVCEKMGMNIDDNKAHDAFYDIECTRKLFNALIKMLGWDNPAQNNN